MGEPFFTNQQTQTVRLGLQKAPRIQPATKPSAQVI